MAQLLIALNDRGAWKAGDVVHIQDDTVQVRKLPGVVATEAASWGKDMPTNNSTSALIRLA